MSLTLLITVPANPGVSVSALAAGLADRTAFHGVAAEGAAVVIRDHLADLGNNRHKTADRFGAPPTGFWERMRAGTVSRADAAAGTVAMPREMAQRFFGGTIRPSGPGAKFLAIPARTEAYGKRPREFGNTLQFVVLPTGPALVLKEDTHRALKSGKNKGQLTAAKGDDDEATHGAGSVMFWLRRSVTQKADPSVLPTDAVLGDSVSETAAAYLDLLLRRLAGNA